MSVRVYGLANCGTCDKARAWLDQHQVTYQFADYREHPLAPADLRTWAAQLGWEKLVNRASYTWRDLSAEQKAAASDAGWLALIAAYPALVKRPLLIKDGVASVGFTDKKYTALFGG